MPQRRARWKAGRAEGRGLDPGQLSLSLRFGKGPQVNLGIWMLIGSSPLFKVGFWRICPGSVVLSYHEQTNKFPAQVISNVSIWIPGNVE